MTFHLTPPDLFHVQAAEGWLELGNPYYAITELDKVEPEQRNHPRILRLRWKIYSQTRNWTAALNVANALVYVAPDEQLGYVGRAIALNALKRVGEARDSLLVVENSFPKDASVRYTLASYECQLGQLDEAFSWLKKACEVGDAKTVRQDALSDPNFKPLWKEIANI